MDPIACDVGVLQRSASFPPSPVIATTWPAARARHHRLLLGVHRPKTL
jgi:hypothetical protein